MILKFHLVSRYIASETFLLEWLSLQKKIKSKWSEFFRQFSFFLYEQRREVMLTFFLIKIKIILAGNGWSKILQTWLGTLSAFFTPLSLNYKFFSHVQLVKDARIKKKFPILKKYSLEENCQKLMHLYWRNTKK